MEENLIEVEESRALAHVEKVASVESIPGADNIVKIKVLGWNLIAMKDEFKEGDKCVYIEIDSKVPEDDIRFAFLSKRKYKIKTIKFNKFNVISQGIALPLSSFPELADKNIGDNVTKELRITKIITQEEAFLRKQRMVDRNALPKFRFKWFRNFVLKHPRLKKYFINREVKRRLKEKSFPVWIQKTDETRVENMPWILEYKLPLIETEKIDGTSTTFAIEFYNKRHTKYDFIICSRNVRMNKKGETARCFFDTDVYSEIAKKYDIENKLKELAKELHTDVIILQGETYGDGIQGNPYKLPKDEIRFAGYNLKVGYKEEKEYKFTRFNSIKAKEIVGKYGIDWVPIINIFYSMPNTMEEFKAHAIGQSVINTEVLREGFVYRSEFDENLSFKNVSNEYLLKHNN